jgi:hypothetical protein
LLKKFFLALSLALVTVYLFTPEPALAQTPHIACDHAANNASAYVKSNEGDDCIDAAINDVDAITAFATDANDSLTAAQIRGGAWLTISSTATLTATRTLDMPNSIERRLVIKNSTTGSQDITISQNAGRTITIPNGAWADVQLDGVNVDEAAIAISGTELVSATAGDRVPIFDDSEGLIKWIDGTNVGSASAGISAGPGSKSPLLHVRDEKSDSTDGGTATTDTWTVRTINTIVTNEIDGASCCTSNQVTLPAGTYYLIGTSPFFRTQRARIRVWDDTNSAELLLGPNGYGLVASQVQISAPIGGRFSLTGQANLEIQYLVQSTTDTDDLGVDMGSSVTESQTEVYTEIFIWQVENITTQTTDGNYAQALTIDLASGEVATITAMIQGLLSTGADAYSARVFQTCLNIAGTTTAGTEDLTESEVGTPNASLDVQVNCNDTDDRLDLEIRGATSETWDWEITYDVIKQ